MKLEFSLGRCKLRQVQDAGWASTPMIAARQPARKTYITSIAIVAANIGPGGDRHNGPSQASDSVGLASVFRPKRRPGLRRVRKGLIIRRLELFSKEPSALMPRSPARRALRLSGIVSMCVTSWVIVRSSGDNAGTKRLQQQSHRRDGANLGTQESDCKLLRITTRILQQS